MTEGTLGDHLARQSEEELQDWASEVLDDITKEHITALDIMGWRIVRKHNPKSLWPFSIDTRGLPTDEDELGEWAGDVMCEVTDEHAKALDIAGWKIVSQIDPNHKWPFDSKGAGCACPNWCVD